MPLLDLLPDDVVVEEIRAGDSLDPLWYEEQAFVQNAVAKRQLEFTAGRTCARRALARLGVAPTPILRDARGAPLWPAGIVGSITHCDGYAACAAASADAVGALGIDAERARPLPRGVLGDIASPAEVARLEVLAGAEVGTPWDCLLFSAKEATFKAWYPFTKKNLGFRQADVVLKAHGGGFTATLLVTDPRGSGQGSIAGFRGSFRVTEGLVLTAVAETIHAATADPAREA